MLESGHRLGADRAVLLGADPGLQGLYGGLIQLTALLDAQPVLQRGDGVGADRAVDLEGAGDGQVTGGLRAGLRCGLLGCLALTGAFGLRSLALLAAVSLLLLSTLLRLTLIVGALGLLLLGLLLLLLLLVSLLLLGLLLLLLLLLLLVVLLGVATLGCAPGLGSTGQCYATGRPGTRTLHLQERFAGGDLLILAGQVRALGVLGAARGLP